MASFSPEMRVLKRPNLHQFITIRTHASFKRGFIISMLPRPFSTMSKTLIEFSLIWVRSGEQAARKTHDDTQ